MLRRINIFLIVICFTNIFSQQSKIDSLLNLLKGQKNDSSTVITLNLLTFQYLSTGNYTKAFQCANNVIDLSQTLVPSFYIKKAMAYAYSNMGIVIHKQGNYPKALIQYFNSLKLSNEIGDKKGQAAALNNIGNLYSITNDPDKALAQYFKAIKLNEETGNKKWKSINLDNIGSVYQKQNNFDKALEFYFDALKIHEELSDNYGMASLFVNIGSVYEAQAISLKKSPTSNELFNKAIPYYHKALKIFEENEDDNGIAYCYLSFGILNTRIGLKSEARINFNKTISIAKQIQANDICRDAYLGLCELEESETNWKESLRYYKFYISARDSLTNEENTKQIVRSQMNFDFEKKEAETKLEQEKKEAVSFAESKKQKIIIWSVFGILILVIVFAVFAYRSFLQKQKANIEITKQKEIIEVKQKEILDSIHYAKRIQTALLPSEKYLERNLNELNK